MIGHSLGRIDIPFVVPHFRVYEVVSLHVCVLPCIHRKILEMLPKMTSCVTNGGQGRGAVPPRAPKLGPMGRSAEHPAVPPYLPYGLPRHQRHQRRGPLSLGPGPGPEQTIER